MNGQLTSSFFTISPRIFSANTFSGFRNLFTLPPVRPRKGYEDDSSAGVMGVDNGSGDCGTMSTSSLSSGSSLTYISLPAGVAGVPAPLALAAA